MYNVEGWRAHWNVGTHVHVMVKRTSIVCILLGLPAKTPFSRTAIAWQSGAPGMLYVLQWLTFKITSVYSLNIISNKCTNSCSFTFKIPSVYSLYIISNKHIINCSLSFKIISVYNLNIISNKHTINCSLLSK